MSAVNETARSLTRPRSADTLERCVGFEPHPVPIYADEFCVAPVYGDDGRPHYCGRPRSEHGSEPD